MKLKPCPFCGEHLKPEYINDELAHYHHPVNNCAISHKTLFSEKYEAWNVRSDVDSLLSVSPWVPVSERFPTKEECESEGWHVNFAVKREKLKYWLRASYSVENGNWISASQLPVIFKDVTHWMPIPKIDSH